MRFNSIKEISKKQKAPSGIQALTSQSQSFDEEDFSIDDENTENGIPIGTFWDFFTPLKEKNKKMAVKILTALGL